MSEARFGDRDDECVFGVFDGYGEFGMECVRFVVMRVLMEMVK